MINPHEFIRAKVKIRPFNEENVRDGSFNYIHVEDVCYLMGLYEQEIKEIKKLLPSELELTKSEILERLNYPANTKLTIIDEKGEK